MFHASEPSQKLSWVYSAGADTATPAPAQVKPRNQSELTQPFCIFRSSGKMMAQGCSKGSILAASWINTCFQRALRHMVSYRAGEGIKLNCQLLEDRETCDRWHPADVFSG